MLNYNKVKVYYCVHYFLNNYHRLTPLRVPSRVPVNTVSVYSVNIYCQVKSKAGLSENASHDDTCCDKDTHTPWLRTQMVCT